MAKEKVNGPDLTDPHTTVKLLVDGMNLDETGRKHMDALTEFLLAGGTIGDLHDLKDEDYEAIYSMAHNHYKNAKYDDSALLFRFLCICDPLGFRWWMGMGSSYQMLARYPEAVNAFAQATALDIDDPRPPLQAGFCFFKLGDGEKAQAALEQCQLTCGKKDQFAKFKQQATILLESVRKMPKPTTKETQS